MSSNLFSLEGMRILVTGASGGIGSSAAKACASLGAEIVLVDIKSATATEAQLKDAGNVVTSFIASTVNRTEIEACIEQTWPLDAVIDCSGYYPTGDWLEDDDWDDESRKVIDVNVLGPINIARAVLPRMMKRRSGRIVLMGSLAGRSGGAGTATQAHYAAAKGGVHALVRWLSRRGAPNGVLVNAIAPGPVDTPMNAGIRIKPSAHPMQRIASADEIGWPAAFLCSPASGYISGVVLDVNGGHHFS